MPKSLTEFSLLLLVLLLVAVACTTERVVEVTVERAVKVVETVIVDRPFEVPVPQTVIVEKEITVEVPVEREVKVIETVLVEKAIEVPVPQTVIVEKEITVEVPVEREIRVVETVLVQREVTRVVTVAPVSTAPSDASTPAPATKAAPAAKQPEPPISGQDMSGEVIIAVRRVEGVDGLPTAGPSHWSTTVSGGVEEYLFHYGDGDPMTPELVETWDIDPRGERVRLTMKRGPEGTGIPFNPPFGYEDLNFGVADADAVVRYLNETNANVNYDTAFGDSGDIAAIFREAHKIDDWTVEIGLVSPIFYCLPLSQFGCLSAARGLFYLAHGDSMGVEWAEEHHIGTGSLVQIACDEGQRCNRFAIKNHWRKAPEFSEFIQIQVADENTRIAMLRNSEVDMAVLDFSKVPGVIQEGYRFLETMPSGFIGQSILFPGNLWEHSHARTGDALKPWSCDKDDPNAYFYSQCGSGPNEGPYVEDYSWIGNPWGTEDAPCADGDGPGRERCGNAPYVDTDNPPGIDDMEQARLVRLALSIAIDRNEINEVFVDGRGTPIYSEYMGPDYPGWDADRATGCWDWIGNRIDCSPLLKGTIFENGVPWQVPNGDIELADALLVAAGYPLVDGKRQGIDSVVLQAYVAEAGQVSLDVADYVTSQWERLGIEIEQVIEDYGGVISQRMRRRVQYLPILKNADVHSNVYPLDFPPPTTDTSSTRPGWGVGFESQPVARWLFEILGEPDKATREEMHLQFVDYSMYWVQYAGVFQIPKGVIAGPRVASWNGRHQHYANVSNNPEFIVLK